MSEVKLNAVWTNAETEVDGHKIYDVHYFEADKRGRSGSRLWSQAEFSGWIRECSQRLEREKRDER